MICQCSKGDVCDCGLCADLSAEVSEWDGEPSQFPWTEARWPLVASILLVVGVILAIWVV